MSFGRRLPCVQEGRAYVTETWRHDGQTRSRMTYPGMAVLMVYLLYLLDGCNSADSVLLSHDDNMSTTEPLVALTSETVPDVIVNEPNNTKSQKDNSTETDRTRINDVITKLGISKSNDAAVTTEQNEVQRVESFSGHYDTTVDSMVTQIPILESTSATEPPTPKPYTRREVYHRGYLLKHPPPAPRTFHPPDHTEGLLRMPNSIHLARVQNFRDEPDVDAGNRKKRKHGANKERFYNYKLLYDTIKGNTGNDSKRKKTEFYAWIFGAVMLGLGSLTTVASCFVFCFCGERVRQKRRIKRARRNKVKNGGGEYQRVESVSSIVDHVGEEQSELYEDQIDNVTII